MDDTVSHSAVRTFLIADIRGYTTFTVERGDAAAARLATRFAELTGEVVAAFGGAVIEVRGDEALAVFTSTRQALRAAVELQHRFVVERNDTLPLNVGIGLDAGEAIPVNGGYRGAALNLAARLCSIAGPGEVLATRTVTTLSGAMEGLATTELEPVTLKGYADPIPVLRVGSAGAVAQPRAGQIPMPPLPRGTAAFLYTDIEGSTRLWQEHSELMPEVLVRHDALLRQAIEHERGTIFRNVGDGCCAAFVHADAALRAAVGAQRSLMAEQWPHGNTLAVRMAIHAGSAEMREGAYVGHDLNRVARVLSAAHGGQVLLTRSAYDLVQDHLSPDITLRDLGLYQLKDLLEPEHIYQVAAPDLPDNFVPLVVPPDQRVPTVRDLPSGGFLGALATGSLVARDAEMERLREAVDAAESGAGRCVLLAGEPGIGKTRLAQEATRELRDRGFLIAAGSSFEQQQTVPYYPFRDVLTTLHGAVSPGLRAQVAQFWPYLGRLLPAAGSTVSVQLDGTEEQEWLRRAVVGFVCAAVQESPIAILLDDLQWADEASLDLLLRLALQTRGNRVLLLGTYRDDDRQRPDTLQAPLERTLRDLYRAGLLERIMVPGLSEDATYALIASTLTAEIPGDAVAAVYRQTNGNPFFTQEVLQSLVERGAVSWRNGRWEWHEVDEIEVPENVRAVLDERLARLQEKTRQILGAASVLGQTFRFDELQALGGEDEDAVEEALDEAVQRGILRETGDLYRFHHALTHAALYGDLPGRRKRRLHRAAGEALEARSEQDRTGRDAELAQHFLEGGDRVRALTYSLRAGQAASAVFAHREAARHYQRACDLARAVGDTVHLQEALRALGASLNLIGRYDAAEDALDEALHLARREHDLDGEIEAVICLLRHAPERGKQDRALRWVSSLLPRLQDAPASLRTLAFFNAYAYFLVQTVQLDEGLRVAQQTVEMAGALSDDDELARSKVILGHLLLWHGRGSETAALLEPVVPYLEDAGYLSDAMRSASLLAQVDWFRGNLRVSLRWRGQSLALARRVGAAAQAVYETCMLGYLHLSLGDVDLARDEGMRAVAEARQMDRSTMTGAPLGLLATLAWMQGEWDDLERHAREMIALSEDSDEPWWRRHGEHILALRELLEGQPAQALARMEPLLVDVELDIQEQTLFLPALAESYLGIGDVQRAQKVLDVPLALRGRETQGMLTDTLRVQAMLLRKRGDLSGAGVILDEMLGLTRSMPSPFAEAQALVEYAHLEATRNSPTAARERLGQALVLFRQLGARPFVGQTEKTLAQSAR